MLPINKFKAGSVIFKEGDNDKTMFIVIEGSVQTYVTRNGREIDLAVIKKHECFGEIEMYANKPRTSSAKAITDVRLVYIKTRMQVNQFIAQYPSFSGKLMRMMGERLAEINAKL